MGNCRSNDAVLNNQHAQNQVQNYGNQQQQQQQQVQQAAVFQQHVAVPVNQPQPVAVAVPMNNRHPDNLVVPGLQKEEEYNQAMANAIDASKINLPNQYQLQNQQPGPPPYQDLKQRYQPPPAAMSAPPYQPPANQPPPNYQQYQQPPPNYQPPQQQPVDNPHQYLRRNMRPASARLDGVLDPKQMPVIAIDFGTSRSAFAYAIPGIDAVHLGAPANSVIREDVQVKSETTVVLDADYKAIGFGNKGKLEKYVNSAERNNRLLYYQFKMHLRDLPDSKANPLIPDVSGKQVPLLTILTAALVYISDSAIAHIKTNLRMDVSKKDVFWVLTVPAIWNEVSNDFMKQAAVKAGLIDFTMSPRLTVVREPEGGCEDLLESVERKETLTVLSNDLQILILDCGGGTNDMSFMKVIGTNPLVCQEIKNPSGGCAGATFIDQYFLNMLRYVFASQDITIKLMSLPSFISLLDDWEAFKMKFSGDVNEQYVCNLTECIDEYNEVYPNEKIDNKFLQNQVGAYNGTRSAKESLVYKNRNKITISSSIIKEWFLPITSKIVEDLIRELEAPECRGIGAVYMIGGFCGNKFLQYEIKNAIADFCARTGRAIKPFESPNPSVAIVKGAVYKVLRNRVAFHLAKYTYGIKSLYDYDPKTHSPNHIQRQPGMDDFVLVLSKYIDKNEMIKVKYETEAQEFYPMDDKQDTAVVELLCLDKKQDGFIYCDNNPELHTLSRITIPIDTTVPMEDRKVLVSLNVDNDLTIIVRDINGNRLRDANIVQFAHPGVARLPAVKY